MASASETSPTSSSRPLHARRRSSAQTDTLAAEVGRLPKRVIKRNRKITSCFPCREKKQKCNRVHPVCGECAASGVQCTYVSSIEEIEALRLKQSTGDKLSDAGEDTSTAPSETEAAASSTHDADIDQRENTLSVFGGEIVKPSEVNKIPLTADSDLFCAGPSTSGLLLQSAILHQHNAAVSYERVRNARAHAVAEVLSNIKINLPPLETVRELLNLYHACISWFCDAALPDLFWPRIEPLLAWWYEGQQGLPPDPVLVPLLFMMLALGLQAKRTSDPLVPAHFGPNYIIVEGCSSEVTLLLAVSMMTVMLQMSCPANWAIAYSAPLDLVRVSLLRAIWHLGEHNLQTTSTLLASTVKLAQSAGLHRDPCHWQGMGREEAHIRRNLWHNVTFFEVSVSNRVGLPPALVSERSDCQIPDDYEDLVLVFARLPPEAKSGARPYAPPATCFNYQRARFQVAELLLEQNSHYFGVQPPSREVCNELSAKYERWREMLPPHLIFESDKDGPVFQRPARDARPLGKSNKSYFQRKLLELIFLSGQTSIRRPYLLADPNKRGVFGRQALHRCLSASQRMIWLVDEYMELNPPFIILNVLIYHLFNASVIMTVHTQSMESSIVAHLAQTLELALKLMRRVAETPRWHQVAQQAASYLETIELLKDATREQNRKDAELRKAADETRRWQRNEAPSSFNGSAQRGGRAPLSTPPAEAGTTVSPAGGYEDIQTTNSSPMPTTIPTHSTSLRTSMSSSGLPALGLDTDSVSGLGLDFDAVVSNLLPEAALTSSASTSATLATITAPPSEAATDWSSLQFAAGGHLFFAPAVAGGESAIAGPFVAEQLLPSQTPLPISTSAGATGVVGAMDVGHGSTGPTMSDTTWSMLGHPFLPNAVQAYPDETSLGPATHAPNELLFQAPPPLAGVSDEGQHGRYRILPPESLMYDPQMTPPWMALPHEEHRHHHHLQHLPQQQGQHQHHQQQHHHQHDQHHHHHHNQQQHEQQLHPQAQSYPQPRSGQGHGQGQMPHGAPHHTSSGPRR